MREFIREELSGWKRWEVIWLFSACAVITILSVYWHDSLMGIVSATTGTASVICSGKGKLSGFLFGIVNAILYAIIAYHARYYGETILNLLFYLPMHFYGFYVWSKHMNPETHEVVKKRMTAKGRCILAAVVICGTTLYGFFLRRLGGALPFVDAMSTVTSIVAMVVAVKMFMEQWVIWIVVDTVSVTMWTIAFTRGSESIATLLMKSIFLGNAIIMFVKWSREAKGNAD